MAKVLVLGGRGMIGAGVVSALESAHIEVLKTSRHPADGSSIQFEVGKTPIADVLANLEPGDFVFNAIGLIKQRINEDLASDRLRAIQLNSDFPYRLSGAAAQFGVNIIQVATDCVYEGADGDYLENSPQDATDVYGKTKSLGEVPAPNVMHLRCSVIGPETSGGLSLLEWVRKQPQDAQLNGFTNHIWNGLTSSAFGRIVAGIVSNNGFVPGVHHIVPANRVNKHELVQCIAARLGRIDLKFLPTDSASAVNRTLSTNDATGNEKLWRDAGFSVVPTIEKLVDSMAL